MALLRKKVDPLSERAKSLSAEIEALESKIQKLNQQAGVKETNKSGARVRSTALPSGVTLSVNTLKEPEPVFEKVDQKPIKEHPNLTSRKASKPLEDVSTPQQKLGF